MVNVRITQTAVNTVCDDYEPVCLVIEAGGKVAIYLTPDAIPADRLASWDQATCCKLRDDYGVVTAAAMLTSDARDHVRRARKAERAQGEHDEARALISGPLGCGGDE